MKNLKWKMARVYVHIDEKNRVNAVMLTYLDEIGEASVQNCEWHYRKGIILNKHIKKFIEKI